MFADTQSDVEQLLNKGCPAVIDILQNSFYTSQATRMITSVMWPEEHSYLAFSHSSCLINDKECERQVEKAYKKK